MRSLPVSPADSGSAWRWRGRSRSSRRSSSSTSRWPRSTPREELLQLRREFSCTIVYVTHDQEEALTLSDRVMVMEGGRIRQIDTPENLLRRPADAYVREFVGENLLRRQKALERFFRPSEDA